CALRTGTRGVEHRAGLVVAPDARFLRAELTRRARGAAAPLRPGAQAGPAPVGLELELTARPVAGRNGLRHQQLGRRARRVDDHARILAGSPETELRGPRLEVHEPAARTQDVDHGVIHAGLDPEAVL